MFWIGKAIGILLHPLLWVLCLIVLAVFTKHEKRKSIFLFSSLIVAFFFSNIWIITNLMLPFHDPPLPMQDTEKYETGILLGGITSYDRTNKEGYFNISSDRFIQTALLYKKGHIKKILVSGGQNGLLKEDDFSEAAFIKKNLTNLGIPANDILTEDGSRNTIENAMFCKSILKANGFDNKKPIVLITSAFHMQRARVIFEEQGFKIRIYPCAISILPGAGKFKPHYLIPSTNAMDWWQTFLKELTGRLYFAISN
jgi:uncharacterized SAM-binding protein YcdF (DUF218 family)